MRMISCTVCLAGTVTELQVRYEVDHDTRACSSRIDASASWHTPSGDSPAMIARMRTWFVLLTAVLLVAVVPLPAATHHTESALLVVSGVTESGEATEQWLSMIHRRLPRERYEALASLHKPFSPEEQAWGDLIRSRVAAWEDEIPGLAEVFRPIMPPREVFIVIGNRGADDAFAHDARTIGFDLAALRANYDDAALTENVGRIDRFFRHEFVHLLQKAWLEVHPWVTDSPLRTALLELWAEGLGNYYSLSARWLSGEGMRSETAARALAALEPRFVARIAALGCATSEGATALTVDLSSGRFDRKWGALTVALWIEGERKGREALRRFVLAGPGGIWDLADRHLPDALRPVLKEARAASSLCTAPAAPGLSAEPPE